MNDQRQRYRKRILHAQEKQSNHLLSESSPTDHGDLSRLYEHRLDDPRPKRFDLAAYLVGNAAQWSIQPRPNWHQNAHRFDLLNTIEIAAAHQPS